MKNLFLSIALVCVILVGCSSNGSPASTAATVEVTLPASMFSEGTIEQAIANAKEQGITDATINKDGSVTYQMPKSVHAELLSFFEKRAMESIEEMKSNKAYQSIKDVESNKNFSEYMLTVDKDVYKKSIENLMLLGFGLDGMYYQAFSGISPDRNQVTINIIDEETGEVFESVIYPKKFMK